MCKMADVLETATQEAYMLRDIDYLCHPPSLHLILTLMKHLIKYTGGWG